MLAIKKIIINFVPDYSATGLIKRFLRDQRPPAGANLYIIYKMYAIVEINGQQFKAEAGKKLFVHHMQNAENGATVEFDKVLLIDNDGAITVGVPTVAGAKVVCEEIGRAHV